VTMASDPKMQSIEDGLAKIDFHHPFTPYDVQENFMRTVYQVLESGEGQIGILESPTGTVSTFAH
jgi:chromosome transmission fidelity protein 1